jgi:hypothetical protein
MSRGLAAGAVVIALAVGLALGLFLGASERKTTTVTVTASEASPATSLPQTVELKRAAILAAAESGDYEALRPLLPESFRYTFGGPVEGGPIAYWQELERTTDQRPLETLAAILKLPYVLSRGTYWWPWAYTVEDVADLSEHERELLAALGPLDTLFAEGTGYLGWRTGIAPDGTWQLFVAGD